MVESAARTIAHLEPLTNDRPIEQPTSESGLAPDPRAEEDVFIGSADTSSASGSRGRRGEDGPEVAPDPMEDVLLRRLTVIQEGDNVLLRLPSDSIKAVVASKEGLVGLGKFGSFPASQLLGLHYDITYEITADPNADESSRQGTPGGEEVSMERNFGQMKGKKRRNNKGKGKDVDGCEGGDGEGKRNVGWRNILRPLKRQALVDAVIEDITETNEFIDDSEEAKQSLLSHEEIAELRAQGLSAEELIQRQIERHDQFELKTDFSKEKWRKRKEKKYLQTVHPLAPSAHNMVNHYALRAPQSILHLREDTMSQLLVLANVRPGGRYLLVDDTGGLVTAAMLERMGCEGSIMTFTETDSPPAWGVLSVMNFAERELECVKWLNWMEADEDYKRPPPPREDDMPSIALSKTLARQKRHNTQVAELNMTRQELHVSNWDGLILATELSPLSILARLTPYLAGSATITAYSPFLQVLAEILAYTKKDPNYLSTNITESWSRAYQVLPGRTHPLMTTSATGGYLFHATRVFPSAYQRESNQRYLERKHKRKRGEKAKADANAVTDIAAAEAATSGLDEFVDGGE